MRLERIRLERVGQGMSLACAVHCAVLPVLAGATAVAGGHGAGGMWFEASMIATAAAIGYGTLGAAFRRHRNPWPLVLLTAGLGLLVGSHLTVSLAAPSVAGALLMVGAQALNRRKPALCCAAH